MIGDTRKQIFDNFHRILSSCMPIASQTGLIVFGAIAFAYYTFKYFTGKFELESFAFRTIVGGFGLLVISLKDLILPIFGSSVVIQLGIPLLLTHLFSYGFSIIAVATTPKLIYTKYLNCIYMNSVIWTSSYYGVRTGQELVSRIPLIGKYFTPETIANLEITGSFVQYTKNLTSWRQSRHEIRAKLGSWYTLLAIPYFAFRGLMAIRTFKGANEKIKKNGFFQYIWETLGDLDYS
jgi:hypothetical protein